MRFGRRHADQAPAMLGHEVDGVWRDFLSRHDEVTFVLAVLVVGDDDHAALPDVFETVLDGVELRCFVQWVIHNDPARLTVTGKYGNSAKVEAHALDVEHDDPKPVEV